MKELHLKIIPHNEQRYNSVGDYWKNGDVEEFRVSDMANNISEIATFIHEVVEKLWCELNGVDDIIVDNFDNLFEEEAKQGKWSDEEPGDDPRSPYYKGHQIALVVERVMTELFGRSWQEHEEAMMKLWRPQEP